MELRNAAHARMLKKETVVLENELWRSPDDDEENDCRLNVQREEHWIHTRLTCSIAVREGCWSYFVTKLNYGIGC